MKTKAPAKRSVRAKIKEMVRIIVEKFDPERIILFGSQARGDAGPDSDVDLLVVMECAGCKREKEIEVTLALNDIRVSKDIIVTRPEDFDWRKNYVGTIEWPATHEGKTLYVRERRTSVINKPMGREGRERPHKRGPHVKTQAEMSC